MNVTSLTPQRLRRAADLKERIDSLQSQFDALVGSVPGTAAPSAQPAVPKKKRRLSAAGRAAIIAGTKARWERMRAAGNGPAAAAKPKRHMSAAAKARLSTIAKARWKKARAAGKKGL